MIEQTCLENTRWIIVLVYFLGAIIGIWMGAMWMDSRIRSKNKRDANVATGEGGKK